MGVESFYSADEITTTFKKFKEKKHLQEMTARLFSLYYSLKEKKNVLDENQMNDELKQFKESVMQWLYQEWDRQGQGTSESAEPVFSLLVEIFPGKPGQVNTGNISKVFTEIEALYKTHQEALSEKMEKIRQGNLSSVSDEDPRITARNSLHSEYLKKAKAEREEIGTLEKQCLNLVAELNKTKTTMDQKVASLNKFIAANEDDDDYDIQKLIDKRKEECRWIYEKYMRQRVPLEKNVLDRCSRLISHDNNQIIAKYIC